MVPPVSHSGGVLGTWGFGGPGQKMKSCGGIYNALMSVCGGFAGLAAFVKRGGGDRGLPPPYAHSPAPVAGADDSASQSVNRGARRRGRRVCLDLTSSGQGISV